MLLSVFTPTHRVEHLPAVWSCLLHQTHKDWEWVVVPNGANYPVIADALIRLVKGDKRAKIVVYSGTTDSVGKLKKFACGHATGDAFVELDHDDILTDDALHAVAQAAERCPSASFIYSDAVTCTHAGHVSLFNPTYGWRHYDCVVGGKPCRTNASFPHNARSLCEILYAPDHVRAWTRAAYEAVGGHNPELDVADDHELIVKSYLAGAHFEHIPRPLYIHRMDGTNTSQVKSGRISQLSRVTRDKYLHALVAEWCRREALPIVELTDGDNEWQQLFTTPDDSVGCFKAFDFLDRIPQADTIQITNLLYRKLVPGGWLLTKTPTVCDDDGKFGRGAFHPAHRSLWSSNSFWPFTDKTQTLPAVQCRFQTVRVTNHYPSDWHKLHLIPYVSWDGMALKDDDANHYPGPKAI